MSAEEPDSSEGKQLTPKFNDLSWWGKFKVRSASCSIGLTAVACKDTKRHPWKYPLYIGYLGLVCSPGFPLPGLSSAIGALSVFMLLRFPKGKWMRWANKELKKSFNKAAMEDFYKDALVESKGPDKMMTVNNWKLLKKTTKHSWRHTAKATSHAWKALKKSFSPL